MQVALSCSSGTRWGWIFLLLPHACRERCEARSYKHMYHRFPGSFSICKPSLTGINMGFPICNSTLIQQTIIEVPLFSKVTVHHVLLAISLLTMFIAVITSLCSIFAHCGRYSKSGEQKQ